MFGSIAARYRSLNKILTLGMDGVWRNAALDAVEAKKGDKILDVCTGTGDLAIRIAKRFPDASVQGIDLSPKMLSIARAHALEAKTGNLSFSEADCAELSFNDETFDGVTISFGLRNLSCTSQNFQKALYQIRRVLKKKGRLVILETSQPPSRIIRTIFHIQVSVLVPIAGMLFAGKKGAYRYLGNSIVKFYDRTGLTKILEKNGFQELRSTTFVFGAVRLSVFEKA